MSESIPTNIRYLRKESLKQERKLFENYFHDLIQNYGVDTTYFRQDTNFPNKLDVTPNLSGLENLIYGENMDTTYFLSGGLVLYMEVENDVFELSKFGLEPNENLTVYFGVKDFETKFIHQLGAKKAYVDNISFSGTHSGTSTIEISSNFAGNQTNTGWLDEFGNYNTDEEKHYDTNVNRDFEAGTGLSGLIKTEVSAKTSGKTTKAFDIFFPNVNTASLRLPINPHIAGTQYYKASGGSYTAYSNGTVNFTTSTYSGSADVAVLYHDITPKNKYNVKIRPYVGDFFRMQFFDDNQEEYEITNIQDRTITPDGINPLLGKYVWKCNAVRRTPSFEEVSGIVQNEENMFNKEIQGLQSYAVEKIADSIYDYTSGEDDVYGGYESTQTVFTSSEQQQQVLARTNRREVTFVSSSGGTVTYGLSSTDNKHDDLDTASYDKGIVYGDDITILDIQTVEEDVADINGDVQSMKLGDKVTLGGVSNNAGVLFKFDTGADLSYLVTDSKNLYYTDKNNNMHKLTDSEHPFTREIPDTFVDLDYLKSDGRDVYFVNTVGESFKLTTNFEETNSNLDTVVNLFSPYYSTGKIKEGLDILEDREGTFLILENGLYLYSDYTNLFAINEDQESTQLTTN
jgi:hypothetical protein